MGLEDFYEQSIASVLSFVFAQENKASQEGEEQEHQASEVQEVVYSQPLLVVRSSPGAAPQEAHPQPFGLLERELPSGFARVVSNVSSTKVVAAALELAIQKFFDWAKESVSFHLVSSKPEFRDPHHFTLSLDDAQGYSLRDGVLYMTDAEMDLAWWKWTEGGERVRVFVNSYGFGYGLVGIKNHVLLRMVYEVLVSVFKGKWGEDVPRERRVEGQHELNLCGASSLPDDVRNFCNSPSSSQFLEGQPSSDFLEGISTQT